MKRILVAALTLPVFLVGCGEQLPEEHLAPAYVEPTPATPTESADGQVIVETDSYNVIVFRRNIEGVDCVIAQTRNGLTMDCEWQ